jgi:hypothetical protein
MLTDFKGFMNLTHHVILLKGGKTQMVVLKDIFFN